MWMTLLQIGVLAVMLTVFAVMARVTVLWARVLFAAAEIVIREFTPRGCDERLHAEVRSILRESVDE